MSKSKNPKITREEREALAAVRPGLDALREALRKPLPATAEHEAAAHRRIAAWAEAWAQTPPLVQAKFNWLEDRLTELLRDRVELHRLKDRLAQEADTSATSGAKGGRKSIKPAGADELILQELARNERARKVNRKSMKQFDQDVATALNNGNPSTDVKNWVTPTQARDWRLVLQRVKAEGTEKGADVSGDCSAPRSETPGLRRKPEIPL